MSSTPIPPGQIIDGQSVSPGDLEVIIRREARRSLSMRLGKGYLIVKAPLSAPQDEVYQFIAKNEEWIQRRFLQAHEGAPERAARAAGAPLMIFNSPYDFVLAPGLSTPIIDHSRKLVEAPLDWKGAPARMALNRIARQALRERAEREGQRLESIEPLRPLLWRIKPLASAWGVCDAKGRITLDPALASLSLPLVDYVIAHEFAHLRYLDHSSSFWALCERLCPGARRRSRELDACSKAC